jgi:GntR family transcriptional repressor for pyruvate dehydrogenase complex
VNDAFLSPSVGLVWAVVKELNIILSIVKHLKACHNGGCKAYPEWQDIATQETNLADVSYGQIVTASAAIQIADAIEQMIVRGQLRVDERLPGEAELATRFGVSRPTVREALKRLAARHLIRSRRGAAGGNFVSGPSPEDLSASIGTATALMVATGQIDLDQIAVARVEMEAACCKLAAENRTTEQLAALQAEIEIEQDMSISDTEFCASEVTFHRLVVDATGNPLMRFLMNAIIEMLLPISNMVIYRVRDRRMIVGFHQRVVTALEQRNADDAIAAVRELIAYTRDLYVAADAARKARELASRNA